MSINVSLTSLAIVLWSGMMIIAGSIWVLSSQVRKLADLIEEQGKLRARDSIRLARDARTAGGGPLPARATLRFVDRPASRA